MGQKKQKEKAVAKARAWNLSVSTKHSVEISKFLRYRNTAWAKKYLEGVIELKKAIPFHRFRRDVGHKPGMSSGRYPQKAAQAFLALVKSIEANAQFQGMDSSNLKITKIIANRAAIPYTGGRWRHSTRRTNLEMEVQEKNPKLKKGAEENTKKRKVEKQVKVKGEKQ